MFNLALFRCYCNADNVSPNYPECERSAIIVLQNNNPNSRATPHTSRAPQACSVFVLSGRWKYMPGSSRSCESCSTALAYVILDG
jgi:hypothetical protein